MDYQKYAALPLFQEKNKGNALEKLESKPVSKNQ